MEHKQYGSDHSGQGRVRNPGDEQVPNVKTDDYEGPDRRKGAVIRLIDQAIDNGVVLGAIAFSMFLILGTLSYAIVVVNRNAVDSNDRIRHGIQCVLLEGVEHRQSTAHNDEAIADAVDVTLPEHDITLPALSVDAALDVCQEFFTEEEVEKFFGPGPEEEPEEPEDSIFEPEG